MKRNGILLLILTTTVLTNNMGVQTTEINFEKLTVKITNISWEITEDYNQYENYTQFILDIDYTIHNTNDYNVSLSFGYTGKHFLTHVSANLKDKSISMTDLNPWLFFGAAETIIINQGMTNETIEDLIVFNEKDLSDLPDGSYLFWFYLYGNNSYGEEGESIIDSIRTKITMINGNPTFNYNYGFTILLSYNGSISVILSVMGFVLFLRKLKWISKSR